MKLVDVFQDFAGQKRAEKIFQTTIILFAVRDVSFLPQSYSLDLMVLMI